VRAETVTGAGQVTSGASATGGGGAGVGALGVLLHPAQQISTSSVRKTFIVSPPFFNSNSVNGDRWAADTCVPCRYVGQANGRVAPREITFV